MTDPPLSSERAARKRAILESAVRTFAENGFLSSRTRDIAAEAGVAEGTIYLYFESKEDLLLTAFSEEVNAFCGAVHTLLQDDLPFEETLTRFIRMQFEEIEADPALATVLLLESRQTTRFYGSEVREVMRTYATAVDQLLESGVKQGRVRADLDIPLARRMLIGALEEIEVDWLLGDRTLPLTPLAEGVAMGFYRGLAVRGPDA